MTEPTTFQSTEAVTRMREQARQMLHDYDRRMRWLRISSVWTQVFSAMLTMSIPIFVYLFRYYEAMPILVTVISVFAASTAMYQFATNPELRWMQYAVYRTRLQNALLSVDLSSYANGVRSPESLRQLTAEMRQRLDSVHDLWYPGGLSPMEVENSEKQAP